MVLFEVLFLAIFWAWVISAGLFLRHTILPKSPLLQQPEQFQLSAATIKFKATDGVWLEGWKITSNPSQPWVILCHGLGANRADTLAIAAGLATFGFNLFMFDFRGHGDSAGHTTSLGWQEQRDLEGVLAFLGRQPDIPAKPYGIYGISLGGAVALMVAARDERLGAVAVDSPYTNLEQTLGDHLKLMYPLPEIPFLWFVLLTYRLRFGVWPRKISPSDDASKLRPRPLLLIQGEQDSRMPVNSARQLFSNAGEPKELWLVPEAGHLDAFRLNPEDYCLRLAKFYRTYLK